MASNDRQSRPEGVSIENTQRRKLTEGMRPGDLDDLVLPMISVDEYESKLDEKAIVIGFYVHDRDAADDLNRYVQKSPVQLLDSEVSPAPDSKGYYLVFIELLNDRRIVENIESILQEVSPLCGASKWQMSVHGQEGVIGFDPDTLSEKFAKMRADLDSQASSETDGRIMEFLEASDLSDAFVEHGRLILKGYDSEFHGEIIGLGECDTLLNTHNLTESAIDLNLTDIAESLKLTRLLGEGWLSCRVGDHSILQRVGSDMTLLLRNAAFI